MVSRSCGGYQPLPKHEFLFDVSRFYASRSTFIAALTIAHYRLVGIDMHGAKTSCSHTVLAMQGFMGGTPLTRSPRLDATSFPAPCETVGFVKKYSFG